MARTFNTSLRALAYRLRRFKQILNEELRNEVLKHEDVIVAMIAQQQLYEKGITGKGTEIASYAPYKPRTISIKQKKGQPTDRVTLKDTGKFYRSMHIVFNDDGFYITAADKKTDYLVSKYGITIFRLTDENLKILLHDYIQPELQEKLKKYLTDERV